MKQVLSKNLNDEELLYKALEGLEKGHRVAIAVIIEKIGSGPRKPGAKMVIYDDGRYFGTLGGGVFERMVLEHALQAIKKGKPRIERYSFSGDETRHVKTHETGLLCGGTITVYIDVLKPVPRAFIVGAGRIGKPLADLLNMLGFKIMIADPNKDLLSKEIFPYAQELIHGTPEYIGKYIEEKVRPSDIVFIVHGETNVDVPVLKHVLKSKAPFIGVLGSKRKVIEYAKILVREGIPLDDIVNKVRAPIGIDIGAETPEEIAVSVVAQVISWIHGVEKDSFKTLNIMNSNTVIDLLRKEVEDKE